MIELLLSQILNGVVIGAVYALIALGFSLVTSSTSRRVPC